MKWDIINELKDKHVNFQQLWLVPFQIIEKIGVGTYRLKDLEGDRNPLPINGQILKGYFNELPIK